MALWLGGLPLDWAAAALSCCAACLLLVATMPSPHEPNEGGELRGSPA